MKKGIGLVEVVIGLGIITAAIVALTVSYGLFLRNVSAQTDSIKGQYLLEEGMEAIRSIRDGGWVYISNLSTTSDYDVYFNGVGYEATSTLNAIDGKFYRTVAFDEVYRDGSDDIALSGTLDPLTRKVIVIVSWEGRVGTTTTSLETYLADIFINQ